LVIQQAIQRPGFRLTQALRTWSFAKRQEICRGQFDVIFKPEQTPNVLSRVRGIRASVRPIDNGGHRGLGLRAPLCPHYPEYPGFAVGMKRPVKRRDPAHDRPTEQCVQQRQQ
jgi:hypothetical protein